VKRITKQFARKQPGRYISFLIMELEQKGGHPQELKILQAEQKLRADEDGAGTATGRPQGGGRRQSSMIPGEQNNRGGHQRSPPLLIP
jgi:hypothetical protein